ncbi:CFF_collapsed_G0026190.mRNA.1.CDS.1 [Saccharomyces cerevisiae]|nr:CFF_collapsed_G0026190.mRNA.1.CDS.1 [Saccharomyces cerevisiae]
MTVSSLQAPHPHPHPLPLVAPDSIIPSSRASISGVSPNPHYSIWFNRFYCFHASTTSLHPLHPPPASCPGSPTVVVSCSRNKRTPGNIYTITTTVPCLIYHCHHHICDENGCHVPAPTATDATATVSSPSHTTTVTVTHCDNNGCNNQDCSLLNVLKKLQQPPFLQNHTLLLPLLTVTTTAVTPRLSLPRLPNKHHWPLAQSPSLLLQLLILLASPSTFNWYCRSFEGMAAGLRTNGFK